MDASKGAQPDHSAHTSTTAGGEGMGLGGGGWGGLGGSWAGGGLGGGLDTCMQLHSMSHPITESEPDRTIQAYRHRWGRRRGGAGWQRCRWRRGRSRWAWGSDCRHWAWGDSACRTGGGAEGRVWGRWGRGWGRRRRRCWWPWRRLQRWCRRRHGRGRAGCDCRQRQGQDAAGERRRADWG